MKNTISIIAFLITGFIAILNAYAGSGGVLIDPGHSPKSPGTISCSGKPEYLYNVALANAVAVFLNSKQISVTQTRKENQEVSLLERTQRRGGRDLLLSIHHDSVQPSFLSRKSKKLGYCSQKAKGFSIFVSRKNPFYEASLRYANDLGTQLLKRGLSPTLHHAEKITGENRELLVACLGSA